MNSYNCVVLLSLATLAGNGFLLLVSCEPRLIRTVGLGEQNYMVDTGDSFALTTESLDNFGIATASVNGASVQWYDGAQCLTRTKSLMSLKPWEKNAFYQARDQMVTQMNEGLKPSPKSRNFQSFSKETQLLARQQNDLVKHEDNDFSVSSDQLPANMARVFVKPNVVVFVYLDGKVDMKPSQCLSEAEYTLLDQIRSSPNFV